MTTRREALVAAGALAVTGLTARPAGAVTPSADTPHPPAPENASLHALARAKGLRFGSAVGVGAAGSLAGGYHDPAYRALLARECGVLVHENELKWYVLRPDATRFTFERADTLVTFADEHQLALRGHTLLWHHPRWFPAWLESHDFGSRPGTEAERLLVEHVRTVAARFAGRIGSWDVVNETVDPETGGLRETALSRHLGDEVIDIAFHVAREADPHAQLVYNDYMSWEAGHETHQEGVLRLLDGLAERGVPIDALGVQSHIGSGNFDASTGFDTARDEHWRGFLDHVTGLGLDLLITEFDVHDKNLPYDIDARDQAVADLARRYLDLMFSYRQTRELLVWGLADPYSWYQNVWPRRDNAPKRPTPYDSEFRPKPLRDAIADALRAAPARA